LLRLRRIGTSVLAVAAIAASVTVPLAAMDLWRDAAGRIPIAPNPSTPSPTGTAPGPSGLLPQRATGDGLDLLLPSGWDGREYFQPDATGPIVHAATVPLAPLGSEDDDTARATRASLGPLDAAVVLWEVSNDCPCPGFAPAELPLTVPPPDPHPEEGWPVSPGHSDGRARFTIGGRWFDLHVEFGALTPTAASVDRANALLSNVAIRAAVTEDSPPGHPGWVTFHDLQDGISMQGPRDWIARTNLVPALIDPHVTLALATYPAPQGGDCAPDNALADLPRDGMLLWAEERVGPGGAPEVDFPPKPVHVDLGDAGGPFECLGRRAHVARFQVGGRFFTLYVLLGPDAAPSLLADAADAVSSLATEG
jgi:hypothetical protein